MHSPSSFLPHPDLCKTFTLSDNLDMSRSAEDNLNMSRSAEAHQLDRCVQMTAVGFEPTPLRTGALSQRLRPLGQTVLNTYFRKNAHNQNSIHQAMVWNDLAWKNKRKPFTTSFQMLKIHLAWFRKLHLRLRFSYAFPETVIWLKKHNCEHEDKMTFELSGEGTFVQAQCVHLCLASLCCFKRLSQYDMIGTPS